MKTSNNLLLGTVAFAMVVITAGIVGMKRFIPDQLAGKGPVLKEERIVAPYSALNVMHGVQVFLKQSDEPYLEIEADSNLIENIITEVEQGVLTIRLEQLILDYKAMNIYISVSDLDQIMLSSGVHLNTEGSFQTESIMILASSGSEFDMNIEARYLSSNISSGAIGNLSGNVMDLQIESSSGAELYANNLKAQSVRVEVSSGSVVDIYVSGDLTANASSGGIVEYAGNPATDDISTSSGGEVNKKE